jgi:putative transposase
MARPLRIQFPGALYHVMSRGNQRQPIVADDADRQKRLDWLLRAVQTYGWRLHAFVLMTNHEHLFVETPQANLSAGMQYLNGSYTGYFNRRHRRAGHLFQGRFRGHLIEQDGYFLEVSRYLHLNPVRAKIVKLPEQYPWSSFAGYRHARSALDWVTYGRVLGEFGPGPVEARRAYVRFVRAGIAQAAPSPFAAAVSGLILGSTQFVARVRHILGDRPDDPELPQLGRLRERPSLAMIVETVAAQFGHAEAGWRRGHRNDDASRAVAAYLARRCFGYRATDVATALGYAGPSAVSHAVRRIEQGTDPLRATAAALAQKLDRGHIQGVTPDP